MSVLTLNPLPRIEAIEASSVGFPMDEDLSRGFALHGVPEGYKDVHGYHTQIGARLLTDAGCTIRPIIESEFRAENAGFYKPAHTDGLVQRYYQAHTTEPTDEEVASEMLLQAYDLTQDEHERIKELARFMNYPGNAEVVFLGARTSQFINGTLGVVLQDRIPDTQWRCVAGSDTTMIFPNGYDARPASSPTTLYVHTFTTLDDMGVDTTDPRIVSLSRIEPGI